MVATWRRQRRNRKTARTSDQWLPLAGGSYLHCLQRVVGDGHTPLDAVQPLHVLLNVHRRGRHSGQLGEILGDRLKQRRQLLLTLPGGRVMSLRSAAVNHLQRQLV